MTLVLAGLRERGLVYCDGEQVVALAVRDLPVTSWAGAE